ncbi:hypothetical protein B296_00014760 [Ensete ventricosum]|uniref:Uncharacterized protein n=1 Tax=Ensete ventricosum TaxID=4639 RepID=A0A426Y5S8_ENSVE|nr:hypothetical protein B296_00014760 [Ensete ventricosum]
MPDTLSFDSVDSFRAKLHLVTQSLDDVQREFIKLKEELGEGSSAGSPLSMKSRTRGDSMSGHRAYARAMVEKPPHQEKGPKITSEAREAEYPDHDSALVILIRIANARGQDSDSGHWELRRRAIPRVLLEAQLD